MRAFALLPLVLLSSSLPATNADASCLEPREVGQWTNVEPATHIYAVFEQGNARRYVYLRLSQAQPDLLWAWLYTDFKDPTRSNYGVYDWFRRVDR